MNKTVLIITGVVCIILLIVLIAAVIPRIKAAVSRTPLWAYLLILVIVIGLLAFIAVQLFGPKGKNSLFSEQVEGTEIGDAQTDTQLDEKSDETGVGFNMARALEGNVSGDSTVHISVNADTVSIGNTEFADMETFGQAMTSLEAELSGHDIKLEDNYALASMYHEVRDYLDLHEIEYKEKQME
ncbi:MAG: hypothetical protein Q4E54_02045 [Lachnospiraceae bacterium]|nr:hypothetical protein [Lachnospiraceae bacterium]